MKSFVFFSFLLVKNMSLFCILEKVCAYSAMEHYFVGLESSVKILLKGWQEGKLF